MNRRDHCKDSCRDLGIDVTNGNETGTLLISTNSEWQLLG